MKKSFMTTQELEQAMIALFGTVYGSQRKLAEAVGRHEVSVSRWMNGTAPIEKPMAKLIRALVREKQEGPPAKQEPSRAHRKGQKPKTSLMEMM